ncbi:MAG: hypothetical protein Q9227_006374 [Pyrenula ochraceoflavens]
MLPPTHGKLTDNTSSGVRAPMTANVEAEMAWITSPELPKNIPPRPPLSSHQSSSLPSTPYQHPRDLPFRPGSPNERDTLNASPRSIHSESNNLLPSSRRHGNGCRFETGLAFAKRRFPYSLGTDTLPAERPPKEKLSLDEDARLSEEAISLCRTLLPTEESEKQRAQLVAKLEQLLNKQWPGHSIKVNVFGSTGNKLGTRDSDVDICITTDFKELENVCSLAEALAENGMERVVCVSSAKVPIVKMWDPILQLACDLNVNNPVALENTQMIKTYVEIDERVRLLALVIKHWTRRRLLNDAGESMRYGMPLSLNHCAALGATLSSYTWICMIINFLQTRKPPILPALQQYPNLPQKVIDGVNVSYENDFDKLRGFGKKNKETLGQLLFNFFKYYGYEVDYDNAFVSVREGQLADKKTQPTWQIHRLCVQEPFNYSRNLANTADDTSFRGIHFELRRAYGELGKGDLEGCCEQYSHPPEEPRGMGIRSFSHYPRSIPTNPASHIGKANRGSSTLRGGRQMNFQNRMHNGVGRRASSASNRGPSYRPSIYAMTPQEMQVHQQQQQQMLHEQLFHQYQLLQAQEQELRQQLHQQALGQNRAQVPPTWPSHLQFPAYSATESLHDDPVRMRAGTVNHPPLTAPLHQNGFVYTSPSMVHSIPASHGTSTNPPSPLLNAAAPDLRRNRRRSSITNGSSGGSLRAQSQPPRAGPPSLSMQSVNPYSWALADAVPHIHQRSRPMPSPASLQREMEVNGYFPRSPLGYADHDRRRPTEYIGYYVGPMAQSQAQARYAYPVVYTNPPGQMIPSATVSQPRFPEAAPPLSSPPSPNPKVYSQSSAGLHTRNRSSSPIARPPTALRVNGGPLIVDGSRGTSRSQQAEDEVGDEGAALGYSTSGSDELPTRTPSSSEESSDGPAITPMANLQVNSNPRKDIRSFENRVPQQINGLGVRYPHVQAFKEVTPSDQRKIFAHYGNGHSPVGLGINKNTSPLNEQTLSVNQRGRSLTKSMETSPYLSNGIVPETATSASIDRTPTASTNGRKQMVSNDSANPSSGPPNNDAFISHGNTSPNRATAKDSWKIQQKKKYKRSAESGFNHLGGQTLPADARLRKGG